MGQFVGCIDGMRRPASALDYPVVSGNVSLYNETQGQAILPTPAIGGVGLLADAAKASIIAFKRRRRHAHPDRRDRGLARRLALSARAVQDRSGRAEAGAAAGRSRLGEAQRRLRARADRGRHRHRLPRPVRRRPAGGAGRDGAGRASSASTSRRREEAPPCTPSCSARTRPATSCQRRIPRPCWPSAHAAGVAATVLGKHGCRRRVDTRRARPYPSRSCAAPTKAGCRPIWLQNNRRSELTDGDGRRRDRAPDQGGAARREGHDRGSARRRRPLRRACRLRRVQGQDARAAAPDGLSGAQGPHGRRAARAGAADRGRPTAPEDRIHQETIHGHDRAATHQGRHPGATTSCSS